MTTENTDKGQTLAEADSQGHCALGDGSAIPTIAEYRLIIAINSAISDAEVYRLITPLLKDRARLDLLEKCGVQSIYFNDQGQMNPGSMSLRAAIDAHPYLLPNAQLSNDPPSKTS